MPDAATEIRKAINAGHRPHAVRLARAAAENSDADAWLGVSDVMAEHAMFAPLVEAWRRRRGIRGLEERENAPLANALNALALEHVREGRMDDALRLFDEALAIAPLGYVRRNLASALLQKGEFEVALAELDVLLTAEPGNPDSLLLLGIARYQSGDPELAIEPLQSAGESADALLWLVKAQCLLGRRSDALATLNRLRETHRDRAAAMLAVELEEPGSPLHALRDAL
jgi:tetratricopeptide (TPR) repeat protein